MAVSENQVLELVWRKGKPADSPENALGAQVELVGRDGFALFNVSPPRTPSASDVMATGVQRVVPVSSGINSNGEIPFPHDR
jgi:hypothetical protein